MDWNLDAFKASGNTAWDQTADNPVEKQKNWGNHKGLPLQV